jgi:hypothetical protein
VTLSFRQNMAEKSKFFYEFGKTCRVFFSSTFPFFLIRIFFFLFGCAEFLLIIHQRKTLSGAFFFFFSCVV